MSTSGTILSYVNVSGTFIIYFIEQFHLGYPMKLTNKLYFIVEFHVTGVHKTPLSIWAPQNQNFSNP